MPMSMLEEAPSHRRYRENNDTAGDDQAFPTGAERRLHGDNNRSNGVQRISSGGQAP